MRPNEEPNETSTFQHAWLSQQGETEEMAHLATTPNELAALVRSRKKLNRLVTWLFSVVVLCIAGALLFNIYSIEQPWIRLGEAWTFGVVAFLLLGGFGRASHRIQSSESSSQFLRSQHDERRRGYLSIRRWLFLFLPGIAACWWGARSGVADTAINSPWLFLLAVGGLIVAWIGFGMAAKKAARDRDEISKGADK